MAFDFYLLKHIEHLRIIWILLYAIVGVFFDSQKSKVEATKKTSALIQGLKEI